MYVGLITRPVDLGRILGVRAVYISRRLAFVTEESNFRYDRPSIETRLLNTPVGAFRIKSLKVGYPEIIRAVLNENYVTFYTGVDDFTEIKCVIQKDHIPQIAQKLKKIAADIGDRKEACNLIYLPRELPNSIPKRTRGTVSRVFCTGLPDGLDPEEFLVGYYAAKR